MHGKVSILLCHNLLKINNVDFFFFLNVYLQEASLRGIVYICYQLRVKMSHYYIIIICVLRSTV